MNVRRLKRNIFARMWAAARHYSVYPEEEIITYGGIDWIQLEQRQAQRMLVEDTLIEDILESGKEMPVFPALPASYTVARKKDGEIIGVFNSMELAQAAIDKAKSSKKATLVLV